MKKEKNIIKVQRYESPCGLLLLGSFGDKLCLCDWQVEKHRDHVDRRLKRMLCSEFEVGTSEVIEKAARQLDEFFAGKRKEFDVPLLFVGTDFQKTVWNELLEIPFGKTVSYGEMAPVFRFNNLMFRYYETFRYGCCSRFIMCNNGFCTREP